MRSAHYLGLTIDALRLATEANDIHTVVMAMTDMQGRLQGKRLTSDHFLSEVAKHKAEGCNYLLATNVDMVPVGGYEYTSWLTGYGDFVFSPDLSTLRRIPWQTGSALVLCDLESHDGAPVLFSPRQILRQQLERLAKLGLVAYSGTELEFLVFRESYESAWRAGYRNLTPVTQYNVDYSLLDTACIEPLISKIRNCMQQSGIDVEGSKGECNQGQQEINFRYKPALDSADGHVIYKHGAKEIAAQEGYALTFMPKFNEREGNSCHIHLSIRSKDGEPAMADKSSLSILGQQFVAGMLATLSEMTLFYAPNINSYKRFAKGSFAPTTIGWGRDNRTCALRLVGHDHSLRIENRVPGGDVNPYLALAGMIAGGIYGIDNKLSLEAPCRGNAYVADKPQVPSTMKDARSRFLDSQVAEEAFGAEVVLHYAHMAEVEVEEFERSVTDWERYRCFERM